MGKLLGIPEWHALTLWLVAILTIVWGAGWHSFQKTRQRLASKRPNPTYDEFRTLLSNDAGPDVVAWMWTTLEAYYSPLSPHPDDHLLEDARIDDDDVTMDWLPAFAKSRELNWKDWPDWPSGWQLTVRNFERWLQAGVEAARTNANAH